MSGGHNAEKNSTDWAIQARSRLARRRAEKRATKAGQIRALWPDIEAALRRWAEHEDRLRLAS